MITLSSIITQFVTDFLKTYQKHILPSQLNALSALKICRTQLSPVMRVDCTECKNQSFIRAAFMRTSSLPTLSTS